MAWPARASSPAKRVVAWRDLPVFARALFQLAPPRHPRFDPLALAAVTRASRGGDPPIERFVTSDGARLALRRYAGASATDLVLIHGAACYAMQFHRLADTLAARGAANVHVLDMRGHGDSRGLEPDGPMDPSRLADDVAEYLEHLAGSSSARRIVLGGHSAGGGLALAVAGRPAARHVSGWLLLAPFLGYRSHALRPFFGGWLQGVRRIPIVALMLANALNVGRFNHLPIAEFADEPTREDSRFVRRWSFATMLGFGCGASRPRVEHAVPMLLLSGTADECFRPECYPRDLAEIAPHAEVMQIGNAGHWDILVLPQAIDAVGRWLERTGTATEGYHAPRRSTAA